MNKDVSNAYTNEFSFCPNCGSPHIFYIDNRKWGCTDCGFKLYNNVAAAVGMLITDDQNNLLFEVRAKDPQKGKLAIPGGFCDQNESAEQAAIRECREEIGVEPESLEYLCSFPNTYDYKNIRYKTCDLFFIAKITGTGPLIDRLHIQESEVTSLVMKHITTEQDIRDLPLAFESTRKTLYLWLERNKKQ
ncbi:MAG: NUDIX domain-containing protein [Treponema sp.]|nr:NUDIX domain-containing protein [Treponema sp.]